MIKLYLHVNGMFGFGIGNFHPFVAVALACLAVGARSTVRRRVITGAVIIFGCVRGTYKNLKKKKKNYFADECTN